VDSVVLVLGVLNGFPDVQGVRTMKGALEGDSGRVSRFSFVALLACRILAFAGNPAAFVIRDALWHCFVVTLRIVLLAELPFAVALVIVLN
jgi:hypothetical protein